MRYTLRSTGATVALAQGNFLASGGEGSVYVHGDRAFKVYADPTRMIPVQKIDELAAIADPAVIRPVDVLMQGGTPVGYAMRYVERAHPLCQLFTKAYRDRHQLSQEAILSLVWKLRAGMAAVHQAAVLVVDANEMNFLVGERFDEVFLIDVDSYQTRSFPATALMDSVKDWQANGRWTELSDWFSWGVVAFQLFLGIHPYRGKHPRLHGMVDRMRAGVSVFNAEVSLPRVVPPLTTIPEVYRAWFRAIFEEGQRLLPPDGAQAVATVTQRTLHSTDHLVLTRIVAAQGEVAQAWRTRKGTWIVDVAGGLHVVDERDGTQLTVDRPGPGRIVLGRGMTEDDVALVLFDGHAGTLYRWEGGTMVALGRWACTGVMVHAGTFYLHSQHALHEVEMMAVGGRTVAGVRVVANVMPQATQLFPGVAMQDMIGDVVATICPTLGCSHMVRLPEVDGHRVVDARYERGVLAVIGERQGQYDAFVYRVDLPARSVQVAAPLFFVERDVGMRAVNFAVLPSGVCAYMNAQEEVVLFAAGVRHADRRVIADPILGGDMRLTGDDQGLLCWRGSEMYRLTLAGKGV